MDSSPFHHLVFVYGTLLSGEGNHGLLARARRLGSATTHADYELFDVGGYPGMVVGGRTSIRGEVYGVDDVILSRLDTLEGHPDYYQRTTMQLADGRDVQAYVLPEDEARGCPRIPSGDWRTRAMNG